MSLALGQCAYDNSIADSIATHQLRPQRLRQTALGLHAIAENFNQLVWPKRETIPAS
jgi:hypothetical protein